MELLSGTSGYSYKEWLGHFYPEKLPAAEMLAYYAQRFSSVEINNTFYRMPAEPMLAHWVEQVPPHFTFALKAPRRITHIKRLQEPEQNTTEFLRRAAVLGDRLGVVLFQLPHFWKKDLARLRAFLDFLPAGGRFAFEFRNDTWHADDVFATLAERSAMLCVTDTDEGETPFVATSDWGYVRLRRTFYNELDLAGWAEKIAARALPRVFVFFMHEDEALGTRFAAQLNAAWTALGGTLPPSK